MRTPGRWIEVLVCAVLCAVFLVSAEARAARADGERTVVTISDEVLVPDCVPFGINLSYGNDSANASPWVKDRVRASFEGSSYRQCLTGYRRDETGMCTWVGTSEPWQKVHIGAPFTILNGPAKGQGGTVKDITRKEFEHQGELKDFTYYLFDRSYPRFPTDMGEYGLPGLLVERFALDEGHLMRMRSDPSNFWYTNCGQTDVVPRTDVLLGDVPPGSNGRAVCHLIAPDPKQPAHIRFATFRQHLGDNNGRWLVSFWAKAKAGGPSLEVTAVTNETYARQEAPLTGEWKKYELALEVEGFPEPDWRKAKDSGLMWFIWRARGGEVLLDEVRAMQAREQNPTVFRDDLLEVLEKLNVGAVRNHQTGGSTVDNCLTPGHQNHAFTSVRTQKPGPYAGKKRHPFSLHEMYEFCERLGCDPWYSLPGTLHKDEIVKFMEYIGAPPDVGYGKIRAELGHPQPWTEVFRFIHVEFGNEAWNAAPPYHSGGFNGSDYWQGLIAAGKASPYYSENVLFHPAGQAAYPARNAGILKHTTNGDRFSVAPYMLTRVTEQDLEINAAGEDGFFRWMLAWPIFRSLDPRGDMHQNAEIAREAGIELSTYEFNHHTLEQAGLTLDDRKKIFTTMAGGLNVTHTMLLMLKEHGIRVQIAFPLASGSDHGIWDFVLSMRDGHRRYRPTFLGMELANRVIGGDLVQTSHTGADPTWSAHGVFYREWQQEPKPMTYGDLPCLTSYAFRDGSRRGLILVNLDLEREVPVELRFEGGVADGARAYHLKADSITATNEWEHAEPQVRLADERIAGFADGYRTVVAPFSIRGYVWQAD